MLIAEGKCPGCKGRFISTLTLSLKFSMRAEAWRAKAICSCGEDVTWLAAIISAFGAKGNQRIRDIVPPSIWGE